MKNSISNRDDVIDSRDVIARIDELEVEREGLAEVVQDAETAKIGALEPTEDAIEELDDAISAAKAALLDWDEGDEGEELKTLRELAESAEGYADDWHHGATLIRDSYFESYARELADDLHGRAMEKAEWPFNCIDWEKAANELQMDYTSVDFGGVDYWVR